MVTWVAKTKLQPENNKNTKYEIRNTKCAKILSNPKSTCKRSIKSDIIWLESHPQTYSQLVLFRE